MTGTIVYYSHGRGDPLVLDACRKQIARSGLPIISVTLAPLDFGRNLVLAGAEPGILTMFRQQLHGLLAGAPGWIWFAEHDVLYHADHWQFEPPSADRFWYNQNRVQVDVSTGRAVYYRCHQVSALCGPRDLLIAHYEKRIALVEAFGRYERRMGYEPGAPPGRVDDTPSGIWHAEHPNLDLRHDANLTRTRWDVSEFRNKRTCEGWRELSEIPGWGTITGRCRELLQEVASCTP